MGDIATEKQKNLDILEKLSKGKPILDVTKAANTATADAEKRYTSIPFYDVSTIQLMLPPPPLSLSLFLSLALSHTYTHTGSI